MFLKGIPFGLEIKVYNFSFLFLFTCSFDHEIQPRIGFYTKFASFHTLTVYVHRHGFLIGLTIRKIPFFLCRILWVPLKKYAFLAKTAQVQFYYLRFDFEIKKVSSSTSSNSFYRWLSRKAQIYTSSTFL